MKVFSKKNRFWLIILFIVIIKTVLVSHLPAYVIPYSPTDDALLMKTAFHIGSLNWLGPYGPFTIVKGYFFSLFLIFIKIFSLSYMSTVSIFYLTGCLVFIMGIKSLFKSNVYLIIIFAFLAFNPITMDLSVAQRIYRTSIAPAQILLLLGCLFGMYLRRKKTIKKLLPWLIGGGLALSSMWFTREDAMWVLPVTIGVIVVTSLVLTHSYIKIKDKKELIKAVLATIPIIILIICIFLTSILNYINYGIFTTNELTNSNFTKAIQSIYSIKPEKEMDFISVPYSTIEKLYTVSPSINDIRDTLDYNLDLWGSHGHFGEDGEIEDGWFFWALRVSANESGYYDDAKKSNAFFLDVHEEIEQAFDNGLIERRQTMPSALMSPWREKYKDQLPGALFDIFSYVIFYENISAQPIVHDTEYVSRTQLTEFIIKDFVIYDYTSPEILVIINKVIYIANLITAIYRKLGWIVFALSSISYLLLTSLLFFYKSKRKSLIDMWLIATSMILSLLVLAIGVGYTHISAYEAIDSIYLSAAYPLLSAFFGLTICYAIQLIISKYTSHKKGHSNE